MVIPGHIQNGMIVPDGAFSLPEGTEVSIVVRSGPVADGNAMSAEERRRYLDALARIDSVPNENPGDTFSGADHDHALYGGAP
jgi:hypothetical protein